MHEITESDNAIYYQKPGWHGLGVTVQDEIGPVAAAEKMGAIWTCRHDDIYRQRPDGSLVKIESHVMNVRVDNDFELGLVGRDWNIWQPLEFAQFCESLAKEGDVVTIETAGTIRGGKKIWMLMRGKSFSVRREEDVVVPYILAATGFDGFTGLMATPTTLRVECSNMLHSVIPDGRMSGRYKACAFHASHTGDLAAKVEDARQALRLYEYARKTQISIYSELASKGIDSDHLKEFFLRAYIKGVEAFPLAPENDEQRKKYEKAQNFIGRCLSLFDEDSARLGANYWIALNSFTETSQRARKSQSARESALLFGVDAQRGLKALQTALALAS